MTPHTRAALYAVAGDLVLTLMDGLIKLIASHYAAVQVAGMRFAAGSVVAGAVFAVLRPGMPSAETIRANLMRSVLVVITATSFFFALGKLPFAEVAALSFLSPLFMVAFGAFFLSERIDGRIVFALITGLAGMALISSPHIGRTHYEPGALWGIAAVLLSAVSYALAVVALRVRATRDPAVTIVLFQNVAPAALLLPVAAFVWQPIAPGHWIVLAGVGVLGVAGHLLLVRAFRIAEAARLAPLHYLVLVWAVVIGFFAYGETPGLMTLAGAGLIVAGTLVTQRAKA